jgi:hypothetical protein
MHFDEGQILQYCHSWVKIERNLKHFQMWDYLKFYKQHLLSFENYFEEYSKNKKFLK